MTACAGPMAALGSRSLSCFRKFMIFPRRACGVGPHLLVALLGACALDTAGAIDDILSYKSLVLGSLSSGERVSGRVSGRQRGRRDLRLFEL